MSESYEILHVSVHEGNASRAGGIRRSDQLKEAVREIGGRTIHIGSRTFAGHQSFVDWIYRIFISCLTVSFCLTHGLRPSALRELAACWLEVRFNLKKMRKPVVYLELNNGISIALLIYLKLLNVKYVCLPHNIEFLVPNQHSEHFRGSKYAINAELMGYHGALKVFAISRFDAAIFSCRGLKPLVFSYYPSDLDVALYTNARAHRCQASDVPEYLILGTSNYTPTYTSIKSFLDLMIKSNGSYRVSIVGFGAERFSAYASERVKILGALSDNELLDVVRCCSAMIINHQQTSGMLTRIIEMNLCGLPQFVLSDYIQAEGLEQYGVRLVSLTDLDGKCLPIVKEFFPKPSSEILLISA